MINFGAIKRQNFWRTPQSSVGFRQPNVLNSKTYITLYNIIPAKLAQNFFKLCNFLILCFSTTSMSNYTVPDQYCCLLHLPLGLKPDESSPEWMNKGDNAWQLTATTLVGMQSVPGLIILYGSMVKRKWAVNSAFMALYAFAMVLLCWVLWAHHMSFGTTMLPLVGKPGLALSEKFLLRQYKFVHVPMADYVYYQFVFAAITVILLAGSLLGRMNFYAWMLFVPLWLTFSYTVGAFSVWGHGFLEKCIIDYAGGYVIHLSSGIAGFTAAFWVRRSVVCVT